MSYGKQTAATIAILMALSASAHALAQTAISPNPVSSKKTTTLQEVVVVGSQLLGRSSTRSLSPIDNLTSQDISRTGATSLVDALRILLPSFGLQEGSQQGIAGTTPAPMLRGLSPNDTIILINGHRLHDSSVITVQNVPGPAFGSSSPDLSQIPISAVSEIQVLRSGAAAQYGSGAVAGVINIVLKGGGSGGSAFVTRGQWSKDQGHNWNGGGDLGAWLGKQRNGWVRFAFGYVHQNPTNRMGPDTRFPTDPTFNTVDSEYGIMQSLSSQASVNMQYNFGSNATFYAFDIIHKRHLTEFGIYRSLSSYKDSEPWAVNIFPDGYNPAQLSTLNDNTTVVGLRGVVFGWNYDVSANVGMNHWKGSLLGSLNYSIPTTTAQNYLTGTYALNQNQFVANFSRDLDIGLQRPLHVLWGLSYRHSSYRVEPGTPDGYLGSGAQSQNSISAANAVSVTRSHPAEFLDLSVTPVENWTVDGAVRHTHYSDFGSDTIWRLSSRYAVTPVIAFRATAATSFLAPTLAQEAFSNKTTTFLPTAVGGSNLAPFEVGVFPVGSPEAIALGAAPLKPEKSHNYSGGVVVTPGGGFTLTADAYQISISNRIVLSNNFIGPAVQQLMEQDGFPFLDGGQYFTNAMNTRTRGIDIVGAQSIHLADGSNLRLSLSANWNKTVVESVVAPPAKLIAIGIDSVVNRPVQGALSTATPRSKILLAATWEKGPWTVMASATRYGEWEDLGGTADTDQVFGSRTLTDLSASYTHDGWTYTLSGHNIFNQYPERINPATGNSFGGLFPYAFDSPFGFSGAYYSATVGYRW